MAGFILSILIGIICIVIGILNRKGNIESLHSYHRKRVSEADRLPFGKRVGLGMIIIGASIVVLGALSIVAEVTGTELFMWIGMGIMGAGFTVGAALAFHAMIKYNKGIF